MYAIQEMVLNSKFFDTLEQITNYIVNREKTD